MLPGRIKANGQENTGKEIRKRNQKRNGTSQRKECKSKARYFLVELKPMSGKIRKMRKQKQKQEEEKERDNCNEKIEMRQDVAW